MTKDQKFLRMYKVKQCLPKFHILYPNVESCTIIYKRIADGPGGNFSDPTPHTQRVNISEDSSMVTVECLNQDCTEGYFYLDTVISDMVTHLETLRKDIMFCENGWQDEERRGVHRCLCKLEYEIQIKYKA